MFFTQHTNQIYAANEHSYSDIFIFEQLEGLNKKELTLLEMNSLEVNFIAVNSRFELNISPKARNEFHAALNHVILNVNDTIPLTQLPILSREITENNIDTYSRLRLTNEFSIWKDTYEQIMFRNLEMTTLSSIDR